MACIVTCVRLGGYVGLRLFLFCCRNMFVDCLKRRFKAENDIYQEHHKQNCC